MSTPDREGAAVEAADLLFDHTYQIGPVSGQACACGWVVPKPQPGDLLTQQDYHRAHVAAVIAAGWVPQSEVTERERAAAEKAWDEGHAVGYQEHADDVLSGHGIVVGPAPSNPYRADRLAGGAS